MNGLRDGLLKEAGIQGETHRGAAVARVRQAVQRRERRRRTIRRAALGCAIGMPLFFMAAYVMSIVYVVNDSSMLLGPYEPDALRTRVYQALLGAGWVAAAIAIAALIWLLRERGPAMYLKSGGNQAAGH